MGDPARGPGDAVNEFARELEGRLATLREQGLRRELRRVESPQGTRIEVGRRTLLNFSSNDYLGLANHPALKEAAIQAVGRYGAGSGASRLICGSLAPHHELEEALAAFKGAEAALSFSSGYATALGTIGALLGKDDVLVLDKLVHACVVDAARLCGAKLRVFAHNDLDELEKILQWAAAQPRATRPASRTLVVTESVFSMDGDLAPLREIVALKDRYGAWLMVDEAHGTGLFGAHRRGVAEALGVSGDIEVQMGTLGKALGAAGGYICGARALIDLLVNRARSFIFSTAPVPASAAAATAGIRLVQSAEGASRHARLAERIGQSRTALASGQPSPVPAATAAVQAPAHRAADPTLHSPIIPLRVGPEASAVELAAALRDRGVFIPAIRYPTVARGQARLRVTVTAAHTAEDIATLASTLRDARRAVRAPS